MAEMRNPKMNETTKANRPAGRGGFTLVEMLVSLGILLIFGLTAVAALSYGSHLLRSSHRRSYAYDTAAFVFQRIERDVAAARGHVWGPDEDSYDERIRFIVDEDANGRQRLRFVRVIRNIADDADDEENLMEVGYVLDDDRRLHRGQLRPLAEEPDDSVFAAENLSPIAENILHFEVRCWSQYTATWLLWVQDDDGNRIDLPFFPWPDPYTPETYNPPLLSWDSARTDNDFELYDPDSEADDLSNNIFPRAFKVVLVVEPTEEFPTGRTLQVRQEAADAIAVNGSLPAYNEQWPYIRINDEWIWFREFVPDERGGVFVGLQRGVRGTAQETHAAGDEVRFGSTFARAFYNPAAREHWGR